MINFKSTWVHISLSTAVLLGGGGFVMIGQAADWTFASGVTVEQVYTDNANLDDEGRSESITRISPRISAYRKGARAKFDLRYAPQYRRYWQETRSDKVVHFLRADGNVELYENHLFVDGWATADQHTIDSGGKTGVDSLTGTSDQTEVYTGGISPYYTTRLGAYLAAEARYSLNRVYYSDENQDSSTGQRIDLVLGSGPDVRALPWQLHLEENRVNYDKLESDDRIRRVRAEANYQLNRTWALAATVGYEEYDLAVSTDRNGELWNVGFVYTPTPRTRLAAGAGQRFFGNDYYLNFSHRAKRVVWHANYSRDLVSARDEVMDTDLFARLDEFGNLVRDPVLSSPVTTSRTGATLTEEYYLQDKFNTVFTFATERTTLTLSAAYIKRNYEQNLLTQDNEDHNLSAFFSRQLRQRLTGFARLSWKDHQQELNDYQQWIATLGSSYRLAQRTSLNLSLSHLDRDATLDTGSYTENRATLGLQMDF